MSDFKIIQCLERFGKKILNFFKHESDLQ